MAGGPRAAGRCGARARIVTAVGRLGRFPRACVFDLDGTLVDSAADITSALVRTLEGEGLPAFDVETVKTMIGGGSRKLIERGLSALGSEQDEARLDRLTHAFEQHYLAEPCLATRIYPGVVDLLDALWRRGAGLGICTNKPAAITELVLAALGLDRYFGAIVAGAEGVPKKPDPAMLLAVLSRLGAQPAESVMIGDSAADVGCARAAGCRVVVVSFGYAGGNVVALGADAVVDDFADMLPVLARLFADAGRE